MTIPIHNTSDNLVKDLRDIRDEISIEIKDMTFEEERAYLDHLLALAPTPDPNNASAKAIT